MRGVVENNLKITEAARVNRAYVNPDGYLGEMFEGAGQTFLPPYFGYVETLSAENGLSGWVASQTPESPPAVCLVVNGEEIARLHPDRNRPDIWEGNRLDFCVGFSFDLETLLPLLLRIDISPAEPLAILVADTPFQLPMRSAWRFCDLVSVLQASQPDPVAEDSLRTLAPHLALDRLVRRASRLMFQPQRTDQAHQQGLIEFASVLSDDLLLVGGWWSERLPTHMSAVLIAAGRKTPAALCGLAYTRADLPQGHCGFIGLLRTSEGVARAGQNLQFVLGLGDHLGGWLDTLRPLRALEPAAALQELQRLAAEHPSAHGTSLLNLAREFLPWAPASDSAGHLGLRVGIDGFYIAPRFGVFISGWAVSPVGVVAEISARVGETVYLLDPMSLEFSPREDLREVFPTLADRIGTAGFSGVLRGHAPLDASTRWTLRLRFTDNSVLLHEVPMERVRVIDHQFDLGLLERTQKSLEFAPWLRDLIDSAYGQSVEPEHLVHFGPQQPQQPLAIHVLPSQERYARMVLDRLERHIGQQAQAGVRALLVLPPTMQRSLCTGWIGIINRHYPTLSLGSCLLPASANAWQVLPALLRATGAQRFAFIGPDVLLTEAGTRAMVAGLLGTASGPGFLRVGYTHAEQTRLLHDAQAFVWNTEDFMQYRRESPAPIGGFWACNGMSHLRSATDLPDAPGPDAPPAAPGAERALHALRLRSPWQGRDIDRINRRLLDPASSFWLQPIPQGALP